MWRRPLPLILVATLLAGAPALAADRPELRCGQEPGTRFFWTEWAFCDLDPHGPERARGIVIWNHGLDGTTAQYRVPAALFLRLLHGRGWDAVRINRHNLGETSRELSLSRAVERTGEEIRAQRARGYRRVVVAGQSFGGYISLEAAAEQRGLFAAIALAPGVTTKGAGADRIDPSITDRLLAGSLAERVAVVFPQGDALFDHAVRGPGALRALARRAGPYLVIDETAPGISGHGGATGGRFALRYGLCMAAFLAADAPPEGRFTCPDSQEWPAARELVLRSWPARARLLGEGAPLPPEMAPLAGLWYGLLGESVIVLGLVDEAGAPRLLYRAATPRIFAGVFEYSIAGGAVHAALGSRTSASVTLRPGASGTAELAWTAAGGSRTLRATLSRAGALPR